MAKARVKSVADPLDAKTFMVSGRVRSAQRAGVDGLRVDMVDKNVGGDVALGSGVTDARGAYRVQYSTERIVTQGKAAPDIQARVFAARKFLGASEVRYNATEVETLDVLLPAATSDSLPSEHETVTGAIASHYKGALSELQETEERQDITYLANKTGWDARAVALAALADQFSKRTGRDAISPAYFYALFRAGLAANEDTLYHADAKTLDAVWKRAMEQGVIPKTQAREIPAVIKQFQALGAQKLLTAPALAGVSSTKEMLAGSGLNAEQQAKFAQIYSANRADLPGLWEAVTKAFGKATADRLQVDGKLGLVTINNAPLMQKLRKVVGERNLGDPLQLAQQGYHRPEKWSELLTADVPLPKEIPGNSPKEKRANYAGYLAAQIRLSYPTAAVAEMVKSGSFAVEMPEQVHAFLTEHQDKFEIGMQPVERYLKRAGAEVEAKTLAQVKRLQRVYQITPSDEAMAGLLKHGIDAAYHVVRYARDAFIQMYAKELGGAASAAQTYDKAMQVHNSVLNIVTGYLYAKNGIALGAQPLALAQAPSDMPGQVLQPAPKGAPVAKQANAPEGTLVAKKANAPEGTLVAKATAANAGDVIAYGALETIFGEMDYCACDHCRSILSPAAYLVDLLHFIDHLTPPAGTENPQTVLLERRPDIQHLPLTCENTNTALPYIDVVNEALEYFVANEVPALSLNGYLGHDTGNAVSEDLLGSPQTFNDGVRDTAYSALLNERFPMPLPFHRPLENLRRYFDKFEAPLPLAMERLRKGDDLERGANPYGWRDILMEEAGLSRAEHEILTNSAAVPLWRMYGFPDGTADAAVIAGLSNAKQFTRRVGITYEDLVAILGTRFVNPGSDLIPKLERLGVEFGMLAKLRANNNAPTDAEFDALLPTGLNAPDPSQYDGDIKAWVKNDANFARIMGLITLTDPTANPDPCNFDHLEFRFAKPMANLADTTNRLGAAEFTRVARFIRLWKKSGWTMDQADAAICALYRADMAPLGAGDIDTVAKLDAGFLRLLPRLGVVLRAMRALKLKPKRDLAPLLACWSPIGTHGDAALYRRMFLNPALLKQDDAFADNGYGEFLADNTKKLADHAEALRSAFNLTGDEYDRIVAALGFDANTILTLPNISAIYRRGWLARKLGFSVRELLLTMAFTADPFAVPDPTNPGILEIVALAQALKARSLKSAAALYLVWNQDLSGKSAPGAAQVGAFARTLRLDLAGVENEFSIQDDPAGAIAQARMTLVYGTQAAAFFFGLLSGTPSVEVAFGDPDGTLAAGPVRTAIDNASGKTDAGDPKLAYDGFRKRLSYSGILTLPVRNAIKAGAGLAAAPFKTAMDALYTASQAAVVPFFARYPELQALHDAYVASADPVAKKRGALLEQILPELVKRRKEQQALQAISAVAQTDLDLAGQLLNSSPIGNSLHSVADDAQPALKDFLSLETQGLSVQFFANDTATGAVIPSSGIAADLDYAPLVAGKGNALAANPAPGVAISAIWSGLVEAPTSGFFNFHVDADAGATVTLELDGASVALTQNATHWVNTDPVELRAGSLHPIVLTVEKVRDVVHVQWEWEPKGQGRTNVPAANFYPKKLFDAFGQSYVRFLKAAALANALGLTANETARPTLNAAGWLNALPVAGEAADPPALLPPLRELLDYARIKSEISPGDERLLEALDDPAAATQDANGLLFVVTRWDPAVLTEVLGHFGKAVADLKDMGQFRRVYDVFSLIAQMGVAGHALIQATTNEPTAELVRDWQAALRARYDDADWRDVVQPINDAMRSLQRDALVAYILHRMGSDPASAHIDTADKLFEYFLMDVQMEPCMQTSRIRHALSSVQLFIERCLMNLEPRVSPATIEPARWEWMKRYRVWEANRKVFLFPENWLEPELRDDKSPFFKEIESELLQCDITDDTAAVALLNYLAKLEEVAKLEPCGMHYVGGDPGLQTADVEHVVARTAGAHRKYFHRSYEGGSWGPWAQIKLDIEDNPVMPVVWNDRLFLFWLRIIKDAPQTAQKPGSGNVLLTSLKTDDIKTDDIKVTVLAVLCWSEFYNGKWQPAKTSDLNRPTLLGYYDPSGANAFDRSTLHFLVYGESDGLRVVVMGDGVCSFLMFNTHSVPLPGEDAPMGEFDILVELAVLGRYRSVDSAPTTLGISYYKNASDVGLTRPVLTAIQNTVAGRITEPWNAPQDRWDIPFFYEDSRHVFYVTSTEEQVTIRQRAPYGVLVDPGIRERADIPPLVLQVDPQRQIGPKFWGDGGPVGPGSGVVDPAPMRRFVTEDAYIRQGLGNMGRVTYGTAQIGPAGAVSKIGTQI